jgi:hypothetical protein
MFDRYPKATNIIKFPGSRRVIFYSNNQLAKFTALTPISAASGIPTIDCESESVFEENRKTI